MRLRDLEHIIRAASSITEDEEIVVLGSQSILASHPAAPAALLVSNEADIFPKNRPERADLIDGVIGELSPFHDTFGYYAQAVGPETAIDLLSERLGETAVEEGRGRRVAEWLDARR